MFVAVVVVANAVAATLLLGIFLAVSKTEIMCYIPRLASFISLLKSSQTKHSWRERKTTNIVGPQTLEMSLLVELNGKDGG